MNHYSLMTILVLLLTCCSNNTLDKSIETNAFWDNSWDYSSKPKPIEDVLYESLPTFKGKNIVYVVNASCSVCIVEALDCYKEYFTSNTNPWPFTFLVDEGHRDIFSYYMEKLNLSGASIALVNDVSLFKQGVYFLDDNHLINYKKWEKH